MLVLLLVRCVNILNVSFSTVLSLYTKNTGSEVLVDFKYCFTCTVEDMKLHRSISQFIAIRLGKWLCNQALSRLNFQFWNDHFVYF